MENECHKLKRKGGQPGNHNALKHGFYTKNGKQRFQEINSLLSDCKLLLEKISSGEEIDLSQFNLL
jgi:hypothetical protein